MMQSQKMKIWSFLYRAEQRKITTLVSKEKNEIQFELNKRQLN